MPFAMPRPTRRPVAVAMATLLVAIASIAPVASGAHGATFVPIGAGYTEATLEQFAAAAAEADDSGAVEILVVPITFGLNAFETSKSERKKNLTLAETRRGQVEAACDTIIPAGETCTAVLAPVLIRDDAFDPANVALVTPGLDGIYILGGDQVVAMQVVANTPFEAALAAAHDAGAVTGGNSAGAAVESADMIAGYVGDNGPEQGFEQGAVDLWLFDGPTDDERGLVYGLQDVLLDQHVLQRGRIARLISASFAAGELGIGLDADTAATIEGSTLLTEIGGLSAAFASDSLTYGSLGQFDGSGTLSIHDVATHVLPPGDGYDLAAREPTIGGVAAPAPDISGRSFPDLGTPTGSGTLLLGGGSPSAAVLDRLVEAAGGPASSIVVLAAGYAKDAVATKDAKALAAELETRGAGAAWFLVNPRSSEAAIAALSAADGILLTAPDPSFVGSALASNASIVDAVESAWLGGAALLADDAAASAVSAAYTADARPEASTGSIESAAIREFRPDSTTVVAGLGWVDVAVEPGIVSNRHWGRLYNLLAAESTAAERLAFGVDAGTALELRSDLAAPLVVGESVVVGLDGRYGSFGVGSNGAVAARWVILDTWVGSAAVAP